MGGTHRQLDLVICVKGSSVDPGCVGWLALTQDAAGIARHCAVGLVLLTALPGHLRLHNYVVDALVSRPANLVTWGRAIRSWGSEV